MVGCLMCVGWVLSGFVAWFVFYVGWLVDCHLWVLVALLFMPLLFVVYCCSFEIAGCG